ncbi:neutral ceramidase [Ischnura elegans]|uniref:neutral ceramidase n=1 Tax=Ischnura elegans TaxID=197161 RepID=UPI001ED86D34|nr:neutral ceramidase [Ischnura elegans]
MFSFKLTAAEAVMSLCSLSAMLTAASASYDIGVGIADVTGPAAEVPFLGYANLEQKGTGIHLRQFSRAFVIGDGRHRVVFVSADLAMVGYSVRAEVIENLQKRYGDIYDDQNVIISATHTHSTPGGFLKQLLFDISVLGFFKQSFDSVVAGITRSIVRAHENMVPGRIFFTQGELLDTSVNRSPSSYEANPEYERSRYPYNTDKQMMQLRFMSTEELGNRPLGVISWYAVHPTSMNNTNTLISSDNVGYASLLFEEEMNLGELPGKGDFVAAFASSNLGDVSPNILGPRCIDTGEPCDELSSTCGGETGKCVAHGPGRDMFESTRIIAERLFGKAMELFGDPDAIEIIGPLKVIHQFVDMPEQEVTYFDRISRSDIKARGCLPAMGYSFGAGTTDGPGARIFGQGSTRENSVWNQVRNLIHQPSSSQVECHGAKPILLPTGEIKFPHEWQPQILSTQLLMLGSPKTVVIAAVPGEFTTMSGRRMRDAVAEEMVAAGAERPIGVIIAGLSNAYADYITTPEEYQVQRYEGASTIYGPHTLTIFLHQYAKLARALVEGTQLDPGPRPPTVPSSSLYSLVTPVLYDSPRWQTKYGQVIEQPPAVVYPGEVVRVKFVAGHPRNNLRQEKTFLTVERQKEDGNWKVIYTDANWCTKFIWERTAFLLGCSEATVEWEVGERDPPGRYRIRHFGSYKYIFGGIYAYDGTSRTFEVRHHIGSGSRQQ